MSLSLLLLLVAAILFAVAAWLGRNLVAAGLFVFMLALILGAGVHLG